MHFGRLLAPVGSLLAAFGSLLVPFGFFFGHFENLLLAFGSFLLALMICVSLLLPFDRCTSFSTSFHFVFPLFDPSRSIFVICLFVFNPAVCKLSLAPPPSEGPERKLP